MVVLQTTDSKMVASMGMKLSADRRKDEELYVRLAHGNEHIGGIEEEYTETENCGEK